MRGATATRVTFSFATATPGGAVPPRPTRCVWYSIRHERSTWPDPREGGAIISDVSRLPREKGQAIRIRLNRPQMPSLEADDRSIGRPGVTFIDRGQKPPLPLMVVRNITDPQFANVNVPLANPGQLHRLVDPDAGGLVPGRWIAPRARRGVAVLKCCPRRCPAMEFSFKPLILFAMIPRYLRRPRQ